MEDLRDVKNDCRDVTDLDHACLYLVAAEKNDGDDGEVHDDHHDRCEHCHDELYADDAVIEIVVCAAEARDLVILADVSLYDARARDVLLNDGVDVVELCLHVVKHGANLTHDEPYEKKLKRERNENDEAEFRIDHNGHHDTADEHDGRAEEDTERRRNEALHHGDIVGESGNEGADGEFIRLLGREGHNVSERIAAQVVTEALRCRGSKSRRAKTGQTAEDNEQKHERTVLRNDGKPFFDRGSVNAVVDDGCHDGRKRKVNENLEDHTDRRADGNIPIGFQIFQKLFHSQHSSSFSVSERMFSLTFLRRRQSSAFSSSESPQISIFSISSALSKRRVSHSRPFSVMNTLVRRVSFLSVLRRIKPSSSIFFKVTLTVGAVKWEFLAISTCVTPSSCAKKRRI